MYLSHYHLKVKPFQTNPDPKFLWMGESHRQAFSMFMNGIAQNRGLILLIGDVGTGKTTLVNALLDSLDENTSVALVQYPGFDILDFYNYLAACFNMGRKFANKGDFLVQFIHFLHEKYTQNQKVLLIIDEAQGLSDKMLDEIRLLSNLEREKHKLLNIFLVGQNEMENILSAPGDAILTQSYYLAPLKEREVKDYINFRLQMAGADYKIFSKGAIREIVVSSKCYPRLINVICDHALLTAYVQAKTKIDVAVVKECTAEHQFDEPDNNELVRSDNHVTKQGVSTPPTKKINFHWALPAGLLISLFILIVAGYFTYLKYDIQVIRPANRSNHKTSVFAVSTEKSSDPDDIEFTEGEAGEKKPKADNQEGVALIEEDLGPSEQPEQNRREMDEPSGGDEGVQSSPDLIASTEEVKKGPSAPIPEGKMVLNIPPNVEELTQEIYPQLDMFLAAVSDYPEPTIRIKSYTDSDGNGGQNKILSMAWAEEVKAYFVSHGMDPARINAIGMSARATVPPHGVQAGGKKHYRIEIEVIQ